MTGVIYHGQKYSLDNIKIGAFSSFGEAVSAILRSALVFFEPSTEPEGFWWKKDIAAGKEVIDDIICYENNGIYTPKVYEGNNKEFHVRIFE